MEPLGNNRGHLVVNGQQVSGRAARLIDWLMRQQATINKPTKGRIIFHFAGDQVSGELTEKIESLDN